MIGTVTRLQARPRSGTPRLARSPRLVRITRPAGPTRPDGLQRVVRSIARFDAAVDHQLDRVRGQPTLDRVMYAASELGDFSLVWHLISAGRAVVPDRQVVHAVRVAAALGAESLLVNGAVKSLFRRHRPPWQPNHRHPLRRPRTSSFPSGHASSAAVAAGLLAERDPLWPAYVAIAAVVATSRVYVGVHHASDVVAGTLLGLGLTHLARRAWPFPDAPD